MPSAGRARVRRWLAGVGLALAAAAAVADDVRLPELFVETWTTRDGLPHNLVLDIDQTPDGYLWLATWEGLARFNGNEFEVFDRARIAGLSDNGIRSVEVAEDGSLWVATARGGVMHQRKGRWGFIREAPEGGYDQVMAVAQQPDGTLWVLTDDAGLDRHTPGQAVRRFTFGGSEPGDIAYALALHPDGRVLVGVGDGLAVVEGDRVRVVGQAEGLPRGPVLSLAVSADGRILAGTERGVFRADAALSFESIHPELLLQAAQSLHVDPDGSIWVGSISSGLYRLDPAGRLDRIGVEHGLPNNRVAAIFRDRESSLWLSTNAGLVRLREAPFRSYGKVSGLPDDYIRAVIEDADGVAWVGTSEGLARMRDGRFEPVQDRPGLGADSILSLGLGRDGGLWVGTYYKGLVKLVDGKVVARLDEEAGLPSNSVRAVVEDADGVLWVGTSRGLARVGPEGITRYGLADGLPRELIISIHTDAAGRIWIGTTKGLAILEDGALRALGPDELGDAQRIFGIAEEDDGTLWLATDRGLLRVRDGRVAAVGTAQGLPYESLFAVVDDRAGGLWLSSNRGVLRIDRAQAHAVADGVQPRLGVDSFGEGDGMASPQCNGGSWPSAYRLGDGTIWFATAGGVAAIDPGRGALSELPPPTVLVERIRVDDVELSVNHHIELQPGVRRVEIAYAAMSHLQSRRIRYRYRMEGFDPGWVEAGTARVAQFTNLPPGEFRFRVAAARPNGEWAGSETSLTVRIPPRLWEHGGFYPALVILTIIAGLGAYRLRVRQLRHDARRLAALVAQGTSELRGQTERLQAIDREKSALLDQLQSQSEAFARQAREDGLTGLANRRAFDEALAREFSRAQRTGSPLCLALLDLDHFKRVNDAYSHAAGDAVLRAMADLMREHCRDMDLVARWGGEEFALLFPATGLADAVAVCERLRLAVEGFDASTIAPGLRITLSIGIAAHIGLAHHDRMLVRADERLYEAKQSGRNRVCS